MKEFIEKLIGRLEETDLNDIQMVVREVLLKYGFPYECVVQDEVWDALDELSTNKFAIGIVNQLAEEYEKEHNNESVKGDLISKSAMIEEVWKRSKDITSEWETAGILNLIQNQPTSCNDGWIPCSERLPEVEADVLLSLRSLDVYTGFRANEEGCFYVEGEGYVELENVLAYKPLPEPYKGE